METNEQWAKGLLVHCMETEEMQQENSPKSRTRCAFVVASKDRRSLPKVALTKTVLHVPT